MGRLLLIGLILSSRAAGEWIPPPKIDDLLKADCVAVGRFVEKDGAVHFVAAETLWGDLAVVESLRKEEDFGVRVEEDGRLVAWTWGSATGVFGDGSFTPEDAKQRAIWFFFKESAQLLVAQPVELTDGFNALRRHAQPPAIFRLLQRLDFDMRRDALEELVAGRDEKVLAELHRIALARESFACTNAVDVLAEARLLDVDRFWEGWISHPYGLQDILAARDRDRVARDLRKAIEAETQPKRLDLLLYQARGDVDTNLRFLDYPSEEVRSRALDNLYGSLWGLALEPAHRPELEALARRLLPLLKDRRRVEPAEPVLRRLDQMLTEEGGVPWVLRVSVPVEPPPTYSEDEERKLVAGRLTSWRRGFVLESAGREVAERFPEEIFERLKEAVAQGGSTGQVYDGMGYVRHPTVFAHLVEAARAANEGADATLRAIGRQNQEMSFDVLKEFLERRIRDTTTVAWPAVIEALGLLRDKRALDLLKGMRDRMEAPYALAYVRARAAHGDPWAIEELLTALGAPSSCELPLDDRDGVIDALLLVDTPEATDAIQRHVRRTWPARWESFEPDFETPNLLWCLGMQNYAGDSRRTTALGEVARRDPRWLAAVALEAMGSSWFTARVCGAHVFRYLTGRSFGFRAEAFSAERVGPLKELQGWWAEHKGESREEWLLSYFREKGFALTNLNDRSSLPALARALTADPLTHDLAVERISVITGKYFTQPKLDCTGSSFFGEGGDGETDQARTTIRVLGWLEARKLLPSPR